MIQNLPNIETMALPPLQIHGGHTETEIARFLAVKREDQSHQDPALITSVLENPSSAPPSAALRLIEPVAFPTCPPSSQQSLFPTDIAMAAPRPIFADIDSILNAPAQRQPPPNPFPRPRLPPPRAHHPREHFLQLPKPSERPPITKSSLIPRAPAEWVGSSGSQQKEDKAQPEPADPQNLISQIATYGRFGYSAAQTVEALKNVGYHWIEEETVWFYWSQLLTLSPAH